MPTLELNKRQFDARPDRVDFRDQYFRARLVSLEPEHPHPSVVEAYLERYCTDGMILDQGEEGACTGFGLAACVNYLHWERWQRDECRGPRPARVSTRMLYHMARLYDEWPGEDYDGSSCRGAMKGWHHHGVCDETLWPYRKRFTEPREGWQQDAAVRPLGAYYRINKDSIVDMQAAIHEVHAIYASGSVHEGWWVKTSDTPPVIDMTDREAGGHAFAIVGYNADGFIIQNSWGGSWGYRGFAVLTYADWVQNGMDAWVAVMGAPVVTHGTAIALNRTPLQQQARARGTTVRLAGGRQSYTYRKPEVAPWSSDAAYEHSLVLGNDGTPLQRLIAVENAAANVADVAFVRPRAWLSAQDTKKLVIYAHGGLNDEEKSVERIRIMAPYFKANGIYPLFITWRTGFGETLRAILEDQARQFGIDLEALRARGMFDDIKDAVLEAKDRAFEAVAEKILAKAVWSQMKQNATAAITAGGGLRLLAVHLEALRAEVAKDLEIHLLGHSAGAILLGHLSNRLVVRKIDIASLGLYAPACTMAFATDFLGKALSARRLSRQRVYFELLSDRRERDDTVGPYGKSLLYLVSRALEDVHKTPLLGLAAAWNPENPDDIVNHRRLGEVAAWRKLWANGPKPREHDDTRVDDGRGPIPITHGSFDNDVAVVSHSIELIRGSKLAIPVENLRGF
jgi:alpha-beta hydrolase superfamily lysophospholipase